MLEDVECEVSLLKEVEYEVRLAQFGGANVLAGSLSLE